MIRIVSMALVAAVALAGCATPAAPDATASSGFTEGKLAGPEVLRALSMDRSLEDRILALDPENVSARDVRETLARAPTPRIVLLHGGVYPVHLAMTSLATFLSEMGYPEAKIRSPTDGSYSYSPYESSERVAGKLAWYYEHDGVRPMMIGHSQGGMQAVKVLHDLAGTFAPALPVWNALTDSPEERTWFRDPVTGKETPVVGSQVVSFASAVGAGGPSSILPNQWAIAPKLREIPDTAAEFTGYFIAIDLFAFNFSPAGIPEFRAIGRSAVRNVLLPADYWHVTTPVTHWLLEDPAKREFIENYAPAKATRENSPEKASDNLMYASDLWFMVKKHWVLEAQRAVKARRTLMAGG